MGTRDITTILENALDDSVIYPFFAVELMFDSAPIRLWTGSQDATIGGDTYGDIYGNTYIGTGNLIDISSIEETSEIAVRGATIVLSGMNSEVISLALQSPYQGRVCNMYFGVKSVNNEYTVEGIHPDLIADFGSGYYITTSDGETYQTSLTQIFSGYMDEMNIDEGPDFGVIELKVENKLIDLERERVRRYTSGYQKSVFPGDLGLDFVESLQDKPLPWGRKG